MSWLRFGTLAVESLTSTILLGVITIYLLALKRKSRDAWYLTGYLGALFVLLLSYTLRYSLFSPAGLATAQISNLIVFGVISLVQFAYHYGTRIFRKESKIVFGVTALAALYVWISLFFEQDSERLYDFTAQYFTVVYSPKVSVFVLLNYVWAITVFARKIVVFSKREGAAGGRDVSSLRALLRPRGRLAMSARSFTYLSLAYTVISLLYLLFQIGVISRGMYTFAFNTGSLLTCLIIFIVYVNNSPQPVSIMTKLIGIPLALLMVAFGITSSALMPLVNRTLGDRYRDDVAIAQLVLDSGGPGQVPPSIAFMLPSSNDPGTLAYLAEDITDEWSDRITSEDAEWRNGLIPEKAGLQPSFIYMDLYDPGSFFFAYTITSRRTQYHIGFRYSQYRFEVHQFALRLLLAIVVATLVVLFIFPTAFRRGLLKPMERLLDAVGQVSSGNYRVRLPVTIEDEIGQLARGYNTMAASLKDAEGNFKALAENANDAILLLAGDGLVLFANARAVEVSGRSVQHLMGMHFSNLLHPDEVGRVTERFEERMSGADDLRVYKTRMLHADGHTVSVEITGAKTIWQTDTADVVVIRDITERELAAEAIQSQQQQLMRTDKLASIGALVAGMAHEINNPNQAISMNARFFGDGLQSIFAVAESGEKVDDTIRIAGMSYGEFKDAAAAAVGDIESSTKRINHIVQELKRLVRGGGSTLFEQTDVNEVVTVVADLSKHSINKATDEFHLDLESHLPMIPADRIGLEQVILNLLQNACQALPSRDKAIEIRTTRAADWIQIEVIDEGIGIPEENLSDIAESFFTTKGEAGGTGLGLSVSLRILKEHGGTLTFKSEVGHGTTAVARLPLSR
jgi:PAS domain S-box-containing protein